MIHSTINPSSAYAGVSGLGQALNSLVTRKRRLQKRGGLQTPGTRVAVTGGRTTAAALGRAEV